MREGGDVAIIAMGLMVAEALKAADLLAAEGIRATVVNMHTCLLYTSSPYFCR